MHLSAHSAAQHQDDGPRSGARKPRAHVTHSLSRRWPPCRFTFVAAAAAIQLATVPQPAHHPCTVEAFRHLLPTTVPVGSGAVRWSVPGSGKNRRRQRSTTRNKKDIKTTKRRRRKKKHTHTQGKAILKRFDKIKYEKSQWESLAPDRDG